MTLIYFSDLFKKKMQSRNQAPMLFKVNIIGISTFLSLFYLLNLFIKFPRPRLFIVIFNFLINKLQLFYPLFMFCYISWILVFRENLGITDHCYNMIPKIRTHNCNTALKHKNVRTGLATHLIRYHLRKQQSVILTKINNISSRNC